MATPKNGSKRSTKDHASEQFMEALKTFVRTRGASYLKDPNITSVGIGYKQKDGQRTDQLSIQFTVGRKVQPEALDDVGTTPIPESFEIDGVEVPTDVLERTFEPSYKLVTEEIPGPRKQRIDPIVPGVSVAHRRISAGTLGCIVYDRVAGTPYILSNWHVLHGPEGRIGDDVVQPGRHDDNRISQNRLGKLIRSHLGAAGDCAIASIEDRTFQTEILDLGVTVRRLAEPQLDDKVVKSGRTTAVTRGIVTRVHTMVSIDYEGDAGVQDIGGFEIGPDPDHPAANDEISMGGDSGSAWLIRNDDGDATDIMAGLHFAGESSSSDDEHAIACYAKSVFEKLEIVLEPPAQPRNGEENGLRRGFDTEFLGKRVALPSLTTIGERTAFTRDGSEVIPYTHFSLAMNEERRFAIWVAWNIDGGRLKRVSRRGIPFRLDPDLPARIQVDDSVYAGNRLDRGHIARRADLCWGSNAEANQANQDSFFFTNITPQMDDFNQSNKQGIWGKLEDAVFEEVDVDNLRVSVIGGPIFHDDDRSFRGVQLPREFYKVIAYVEGGDLKAKAFLLTQNINVREALDLDEFRVFQVSLSEVEQRVALRFPAALKEADDFAEFLESRPELEEERPALESLADIRW